jgi:glycosyltransferase involved in cell wall biosynthesis
MVNISVIIPSYNSKKTISLCLTSIINQDIDEPYEIIVVDSSVDNTPTIVKSEFPNVHFIHFNIRIDPGTARNIGSNLAKGNILAFIDSDCFTSTDWLRKIKQRHKEGYFVVGGSVLNANPQNLISVASYIMEFNRWFPNGEIRFESHIPTCNISYNTKTFKFYSGFSTLYPVEDYLFNKNLHIDNELILFDSNIKVSHYHRSNFSSFIHHQIKRGRGASIIYYQASKLQSFIVKNRLHALCSAPFLVMMKGLTNTYRLFKWRPRFILTLPLWLPVFCLGLLFWSLGFINGSTCKINETQGTNAYHKIRSASTA